jgi:hypothetical protein
MGHGLIGHLLLKMTHKLTSSSLVHFMRIILCMCIYRVIQEERSIFCDVILSVIVRKKVYMSMCLILNVYRDAAV